MAAYIRSLDVNQHLISTSYSNPNGDPVVQGLDALSFTMTHNYGSFDIAAGTAQYVKYVCMCGSIFTLLYHFLLLPSLFLWTSHLQPYKKLQLYKKPSYVAEFGNEV